MLKEILKGNCNGKFKGNFKSDPKREIVMEELLNQINKLDEKHFMTDTILLDRDPKKKIKDKYL